MKSSLGSEDRLCPPEQDKRRRRRYRLALGPTKRRSAGIGDEVPRPEELRAHDRGPVPPPPWARAHLWPGPNASASVCSKQNNFARFGATIARSKR
jgi:hypothetical protein